MMCTTRTAAIALAFAATVFLCRTGGAAAESGSFQMLMSGVQDYTMINHAGAKITGGSLTGTATPVQSSGPFVEGATQIVTCVVYASVSESDTDIRGACTLIDASGDSWFARAQRRVGNIEQGSGGQGRWELVGGTGKYDGLRGSCRYDTEYLAGNRIASTAECTWRK